jgi:hypothetical protein
LALNTDELNYHNRQERINFGAIVGDDSNRDHTPLETPKVEGDLSSRNFGSKKERIAAEIDQDKLKKYSEGPKFVMSKKKKKKKKMNDSVAASDEALLQKQMDALAAESDDFGFTKIGGDEPA